MVSYHIRPVVTGDAWLLGPWAVGSRGKFFQRSYLLCSQRSLRELVSFSRSFVLLGWAGWGDTRVQNQKCYYTRGGDSFVTVELSHLSKACRWRFCVCICMSQASFSRLFLHVSDLWPCPPIKVCINRNISRPILRCVVAAIFFFFRRKAGCSDEIRNNFDSKSKNASMLLVCLLPSPATAMRTYVDVRLLLFERIATR